MDIAMFTESYEPAMGNKRRQILMAPHDGDIKVYSRITDGTKGPHNKWEEVSFDATILGINDAEKLTRTPVGVYVTSADNKAIDAKGYSPVLGTKACSAHTKAAPADSTTNLIEELTSLYESILNGDDNLESYVIDNRSQSGATPVVIPVPTQTMDDVMPAQTAEPKSFQVSLATVPPMELAQRYIHRDIWGHSDFKSFDIARSEGINVLVYGPTGPGKTSAVVAWAAERGLRLATISGNASNVRWLYSRWCWWLWLDRWSSN